MAGNMRHARHFDRLISVLALTLAMSLFLPILPSPAEEKSPVSVEKSKRKDIDDAYQLRSGDRVSIEIYPEDEYVRGGEMTITDNGNVFISSVGTVTIKSKTIGDAEDMIRDILREYFVSPEVVIHLLNPEEMNIVILGEVKRPGAIAFPVGKARFTLMEAIALAGGFTEIANVKKIKIVRKQEDGKAKNFRANAEKIIDGKDEDILLQPRDLIHVGESFF